MLVLGRVPQEKQRNKKQEQKQEAVTFECIFQIHGDIQTLALVMLRLILLKSQLYS